MSGPFGSSQWMYATGGAESQSLRFNDDDTAYLSWTPASAGNRKTWTWSAWVKRGNLSEGILFVADNGTLQTLIRIRSDNTLQVGRYNGTSYNFDLRTTAVLRDVSAWYNVCVVLDTTEATSSDRLKIYINGVQVTAFGTSSYPSLNFDADINNTFVHGLGNFAGGSSSVYFDGYLSEVNFIDGQALDPTSFGETNSKGLWVPKTFAGTYGTNGFYLPFTNDYTVEGFNTVTYRGNGGTQYVGGVGFEPDFVWIKCRSTATTAHNLYDSVRGATKYLQSHSTAAEATLATSLKSFDTDGFTVGSWSEANFSGRTFVAWAWDAGTGSPVSNTDGSITSTVKANPDYGFSIVNFVSTSSAGTVGHGLSQAPELIIAKQRPVASAWAVYSAEIGATKRLQLQTTDAAATDSSWNNTAPTSSVFSQALTSTAGRDIICYCFHSVAGYSDFGSYTGNGSTTGPIVTTGFKPAFVMVKSTSAVGSWRIWDATRNPVNPIDHTLHADDSTVEDNYGVDEIDFLSDGFQPISTGSYHNGSGVTYIYMAFADKREAAFWLDQSGNNNDWTNNNMQESDISLDSPLNNFATLNPLDTSSSTLSEGNLKIVTPASGQGKTRANFNISSGKWYWEFECISATSDIYMIGVSSSTSGLSSYVGANTGEISYYGNNGSTYKDGVNTASYGATYTAGDIVGVALNMDDGEITFYKNNVSQGIAYTGLSGNYSPAFSDGSNSYGATAIANFGQDSSFAGNKVAQGYQDANGKGDFYYEPPAGYLALCTANLPEPAILDGSEHFNTVLYTGNGSTQSITGVGFQPDFTWIKERTTASAHGIYDVVRGNSKVLSSNGTWADYDQSSDLGLESFDTDGFTVDYPNAGDYYINRSGQSYVAWNWKANGSGTTNTDGTITSTVSANPTAGFSIATYTGGAGTVGHGLSQAPEIIIEKKRDTTSDWIVGHTLIDGSYDYLRLNTTATNANSAVAAPTSSVFTPNVGANSVIAYCFHSVEGYSKFGSYTGNGSTDGPFVYTGFRPAFVMVKNATANASATYGSWKILDTSRYSYNGGNPPSLYANASYQEGLRGNGSADTYIERFDLLSNGFKLGGTSSYGIEENQSGVTYIYMAFAESPFKYSNAR